MSGGLKEQWGVGAPAVVGSDEQSQSFKTAFEAEMNAINESLQFTAVNADPARQDPLAARREAIITAYQAAMGEVDAADPAKAQPSIDKVLADAKALNAEAAGFRAEAEKAFT